MYYVGVCNSVYNTLDLTEMLFSIVDRSYRFKHNRDKKVRALIET